jgi:hypothetical protein
MGFSTGLSAWSSRAAVRRVAIPVVRSGIASGATASILLFAAGIGLVAGLCAGQDGWQ